MFADQVLYPQIVSPPSGCFGYGDLMKYPIFIVTLFVLAVATSAFGQGKGVDSQRERVTDNSSNRAPANNGAKQDVGTSGSGINFGKEKAPAVAPIPNPYRLTARRDVLIKAVADVMRDRKLIVDDAASKPDEGIIVSQPYTFIKGAVVSQSELYRYASIENSQSRSWTRGRYTITVEVQPIDGTSANVSVNAKIEGRTDGATGAEWITLQSTQFAEQEFLSALIESVTGSAPAPKP